MFGANLDVDVPYQYLTFMLEDDQELERIGELYSAGKIMTGAVKQRLIDVMSEFNLAFQQRRSGVSDSLVQEFMRIRPLEF